MSIQSEINRISGNVAAAHAAAQEKGGNLPEERVSANLAETVRGIPQTRLLDSNPIGTVISFMGTSAPEDYLICDGAEYSISDYPALADFFRQQFGAENHFGGNGTTTFAVPDMRNLFLRGYHGEAVEQLSGDVGEKQEGTTTPTVSNSGVNIIIPYSSEAGVIYPHKFDTREVFSLFSRGHIDSIGDNAATVSETSTGIITSRPVNMAVLYCIKAVESVPAENTYSTEERQIGTWIDGKPIYRLTIQTVAPSTSEMVGIANLTNYNIDELVSLYGSLRSRDGARVPLNTYNLQSAWCVMCMLGHYYGVTGHPSLGMLVRGANSYLGSPVVVTLEYTKTTD